MTAFIATVTIIVNDDSVKNVDDACDWLTGLLDRDYVFDWGYRRDIFSPSGFHLPTLIQINRPVEKYEDGDFLFPGVISLLRDNRTAD